MSTFILPASGWPTWKVEVEVAASAVSARGCLGAWADNERQRRKRFRLHVGPWAAQIVIATICSRLTANFTTVFTGEALQSDFDVGAYSNLQYIRKKYLTSTLHWQPSSQCNNVNCSFRTPFGQRPQAGCWNLGKVLTIC